MVTDTATERGERPSTETEHRAPRRSDHEDQDPHGRGLRLQRRLQVRPQLRVHRDRQVQPRLHLRQVAQAGERRRAFEEHVTALVAIAGRADPPV
jgi:hypothetical protein